MQADTCQQPTVSSESHNQRQLQKEGAVKLHEGSTNILSAPFGSYREKQTRFSNELSDFTY